MPVVASAGRVSVSPHQITYRTGLLGGRTSTVLINAVQGYRRSGAFVEVMVNGRWINMNCGTAGGAKKILAAIEHTLRGPEPTATPS